MHLLLILPSVLGLAGCVGPQPHAPAKADSAQQRGNVPGTSRQATYEEGAGSEWDVLNQEIVKLHGKGKYDRAVILARKAWELAEANFGADHPNVATSLNNLGGLWAIRGQYKEAHSLFLRGQKIDEKLIEQVTDFPSEERQLRFLASRRWAPEVTLGHLTLHLAQDVSARRDALDLWIRRKGVVLEA